MPLLAVAAALSLVGPTPAPRTAAPLSPPPRELLPLQAAPPAVAPPPPTASAPAGLWGVGALLLVLAAAAVWAARRNRPRQRHLQVIETASLGPKRSLVLVTLERQSLLLSCSEAGVALLHSQPASDELLAANDARRAGLPPAAPPAPLAVAKSPAPGASRSAFETQLGEADDLQRVRLRLAEAQQPPGLAAGLGSLGR